MKTSLKLMVITFLLFVVASTAKKTTAQNDNASVSNFDAKITTLCSKIALATKSSSKLNVAVIEFTNINGKSTDFSRFLCEELTTKLFRTKKFIIIERSQMDKIAKEQKLQLNGPIDSESLEKLGKLLGVDAILIGTITDIPYTIRINARLINTTTGSIYSATNLIIDKDVMVSNLLGIPYRPNPNPPAIIEEPTTRSPNTGNDKNSSQRDKVLGSDFTFKIIRTGMTPDDIVKCEVLVTSTRSDATLLIGNSKSDSETKFQTMSGKKYIAKSIYINDKYKNSTCLEYKFMAGIPTVVTFIFEDAAQDYSELRRLSFHIQPVSENKKASEVVLLF